MSDPKDKRPQAIPPPDSEASDRKRSGRAGFDERGNSVWEWQLDTGVYSRDVNTQKLKKLNLDELSIADTGLNKQLGSDSNKESLPGSGFNPYNSTPQVGGGSSPYDTARALGDKFNNKQPPAKARSLDDMRKLNEAIKAKKRMEEEQQRKGGK
jgi:hypothetical protein